MTQQDFLKTLSLDTLLKARFDPFLLDYHYRLYRKKYLVEIPNLKTQLYFMNKDGEISKIDEYCFTSPKEIIKKVYIFDNNLLHEELKRRPHKVRWYEKKKGGNFAIYKLNKHEIKQSLIPKMRNYKLEKLQNGETFTTSEKGNSMNPLIKSGQEHIIEPSTWESCEINDIVYCKVKGRYYTHLVKAKDLTKGCLIGSNQGSINGWTKHIYGKVAEIL